ncbi:hypothetical protein [Saccharicrinis sp. FJH54]|uniref:hypothetical protein n=1 Tax=Saccharicrinis sp. FJH54 TaxID=3344665 RepID=UPI0035D3F45C
MKNVFIYFAVLTIFISCSPDEYENSERYNFFPLEIQNEWTYNILPESTFYPNQTFNMKVLKDTVLNIQSESIKTYIVESSRSSNDNKWFVFWNHDENGNIIQNGVQTNGEIFLDRSIQYKKNPQVGEFWNFNHIIYGSDSGFFIEESEIKCVNSDTSIVTEAGTFECYIYFDNFKRWEDSDEKRYWFINSDVGLIKYQIITDGEIELEYSLKEYKINN